MLELKALLLTQGMHGMISQVEGLAKALGLDYKHQTIELKPFWNLIPPKISPISENLVKNKFVCDCKVIISCGRKSVIPSIYLKNKFKKKIITIHIQNPKVSPKNFDLIIAPDHDGLSGKNVLISKGALHYLRNNEIEESENYLKPRINREKLVSLIVGGPNKYYDYNDLDIKNIFLKIKLNFIDKGYQLILVPSMRTPQNIIRKAKDFFDDNQIIITEVDKNAYLSSLKLANHIVVTCDSTSMVSEAAITGKPIYVAQMPPIKNNFRFKKFFELFKSLNIIRDLENSVDIWKYDKLNETDRISSYIKQLYKNYDFS